MNSSLHDSYAADYDQQTLAYGCTIADVLFGLTFEFIEPGQMMLDVGIGSGLSSVLFAKAGLQVYGMDFSPAMLAVCARKRIAVDLKQHDLQSIPWPYAAGEFHHLVACGVFHFVGKLDEIFAETNRVLRPKGLFAFTTKVPVEPDSGSVFEETQSGEFIVFSHYTGYVAHLLETASLKLLKQQRCFIGTETFDVWITEKAVG